MEIWQLDTVSSLIQSDKATDAQCEQLLAFRRDSLAWATVFQTAVAMQTPNLKEDPTFLAMEGYFKKLEAKPFFCPVQSLRTLVRLFVVPFRSRFVSQSKSWVLA